MFHFTSTNTVLLIHSWLFVNSFTREAHFCGVCCMGGRIVITEHHLNTTTICSALVLKSFERIKLCLNTQREVLSLSIWTPNVLGTCYPLTFKVMPGFNWISHCVSYSLFPLCLYFLMSTSDWQYLSDIFLYTLALSLPYHTMPQLALLTPKSLLPCKHNLKPFINIVKGEIMKKGKKNNQGIYFAETFCLASLCGIGVYYNNKIHKLLQYYLGSETHFLIIEGTFYTCLWNKWSSAPTLPMFSPQAHWKHSWVYNWAFH